MKNINLIIGVIFLLFLILPSISATQTQQYAKIFLNPFYRDSLVAGTTYNYTLLIITPDKISSVQNAIFGFNAQINGQSQNFTLKVNNKSCNPASYSIATAFSTTGNVQFYYDCSNVINGTGLYTITLLSAVNTGAIVGWVDLTYMNSPAALTIHGTEYQTGDPAKIWLQLLDSDKTPIDNATCFATIYTPNNFKLYSYLQMQHLDNGIYYYDFFAPEVVGVYPVIADCYYVTSSNIYSPTNYSFFTGNVISGNLQSLTTNDGNRMKISEQNVQGPGLDFNVTFTNVSEISLETNLVMGLHGRWSGRTLDSIKMQIWNYSSGAWIDLQNQVLNTGGMDIDTPNTIVINNNLTSMGLLQNKSIKIRLVDQNMTDIDLEKLEIDSLWINLITQSGTGIWANVKGSSEVHVNANGGHLYTWNTLCDDHNSVCAVFSPAPNTPEFEQQWVEGLINETLTINNIYKTSLQDTIEYQTAIGLDCTGVLGITETYDDGTTIDVYDTTLMDVGSQQNCKMEIPIEFEKTQSSLKVNIISDNYPKWEVEWARNIVDGLSPTITNYCNDIATKNNIVYSLPINTTLTTSLDPEVMYCYRAMDDLWYFNAFYNDSLSVTTIGPYLSYLAQSRFYYPLIIDHYNHIKGNIIPVTNMMKVFGTEYQVNDSGKTFLQLLDSTNSPINNASCFATIYYPNNTIWQQDSAMSYLSGSNGLYYLDFTAPITIGVYMVDTQCAFGVTSTTPSNASSYVLYKGWYFGGNGTSLTKIDNSFLSIQEKNSNPGYSNTTVTTLLMAHLDEDNNSLTAEDTSNNSATGTNTNSPTQGIPGVSGTGYYYLGGSSQYTNFAATSKFLVNSTDHYMFCFSFNESVTNANGNRLLDTLGGGNEGVRFSFDGGNAIRFVSDRAGTNAFTLNSPLSYLDSQWHTVCGYANFTTQVLYIDGAQVASQAATQSGQMNATLGINIGSIAGGTGNYVTAGIDEICYMKGTFGSGQTAPILASAYNTTKQCGTANSSLDLNVTISNITTLNITGINPVIYNLLNTYQWSDTTHPIIVQIRNITGSGSWFNLTTLSYSLNTTTNNFQIAGYNNLSQVLQNNSITLRFYTEQASDSPNIFKLDQARLEQSNSVFSQEDTIRGGGEIHITNYHFETNNLSLISEAVWNYVSRNLTYTPDMTDYNRIQLMVWNATTRNLTFYNDTTNYNLIQAMVWNNSVRNLTYYADMTNYSAVQIYVWNYSNRNLTFFPTQLDLTNYTLISQLVWNYVSRNLTYTPDMTNYLTIQSMTWNATNRNLTYYPAQIDLTNYNLISQVVWNFTNRNLTYYNLGNNLSASDVWNYVSRNLTYYQDIVNYTLINQGVWSFDNRNLTYYQVNNISTFDIWNYTNRALTENVSQEVWLYYNKTLTYYPTQIDLTNYNQIQNMIWNYSNRSLTENIPLEVWTYSNRNLTENISMEVWSYYNKTLTYYPDVTDYNLIYSGVWNFTNRNLTYYPLQTDLTNYSLIASTVWAWNGIVVNNILDYFSNAIWNSPSRNLTYYPNQTDMTNYTQIIQGVWDYNNRSLTYYPYNNISVADIWNYANRSLSENIAQEVWVYNNRNLTYYQINNLSASDIWNFNNRSLTENISLEVWSYQNRTLTYYQVNNITPLDIWSYQNRNLTYYPNQTDMTNYSLITSDVWNYFNRSLTFYQVNNLSADDIWNYVNRTLSFYEINNISVNDIWNYNNRNLTFYPNQTDLTNYSNIAFVVWSYPERNLTYYPAQLDLTNYTRINEGVWSYNNRTLTYYYINNITSEEIWNYAQRNLTYTQDVTNYLLIQNLVWNATDRNLTFYPTQLDLTNYSLIANTVWNFNSKNLTYYDLGNNLSSYDVWNFVSRNLTFYPTQLDLTNYTKITENIWTYNNRSLTYYLVNNISTSDIWSYYNRSLTQDIAGQVWMYSDRNLTYMPFNNLSANDIWSFVNRSLTQDIPLEVWTYANRTSTENISYNVWNYYNRTLTYYPEVDLSQIPSNIWNFTNRSLTFYPDMTNYTLINEGVWSYNNRTLTYYYINNISVGDIWNYVSRNLTFALDLTNYNNIQEMVWNASNRNLTYYYWINQTDLTNYNKIQAMVWNASNRNLTYYDLGNNLSAYDVWNYIDRNLTYYYWINQTDLTNYSFITENIWSYNNRSLTYYEINNITSSDIWNYANRSLTQNISKEVWLYYNKTLDYYPYNNLSAQDIWSYVNRSLTQDISFEVWSYNNRTISNNVSFEVWNYYNRTLTFYPEVDLSQVPASIWNYSDRNLTYYYWINQTDLTNYTNIAQSVWMWNGFVVNNLLDFFSNAVWNNSARNLTFYPNQTDLTNYTLINEGIWNYNNRTLTYYPYNNISVNDIWNYANRSLTQDIGQEVWLYVNRNLTYYQVNNLSASDIWNYNNRSLTENISLEVWTYNNKTLTYYQVNDITPEMIWNYTNRNLTYYDLGNNISTSDIWNYINRSLTFYEVNNITSSDIWNYVNRTLTFYEINNISTSDIWNYINRNLTLYPNQTDLTNYTNIQFVVWNYNNKSLTYYPDMTNYSLINEGVWNYFNRTLTQDIAKEVWSYNNRNLTYYEVNNISTNDIWSYFNKSLTENISFEVWNYQDRNLTHYEVNNISIDDIWNYTNRTLTQDIPYEIWSYNNRTLTYYLFNNLSAEEIWNYQNRNLTYSQDIVNYSLINEGVWNFTDRNLTFYQVNNMTASDLWNYYNRTLTQDIAGDVWIYNNRTLTFYPAQIDLTNYTLINEGIWNYLNRTLTQDLANEIWNYGNRSLTYYPPQVDLTNYSAIFKGVWEYNNRNLTFYQVNNMTVADVWNYFNKTLNQDISGEVWTYNNRNLTFYDLGNNISISDIWNYINRSLSDNIAQQVWVYNDRNLTYYQVNNITTQDIWAYTNKTLNQNISGEIWTYNNRVLTYYPDVTNYTLINEGIWNYPDRNLTYYQDATNYTIISTITNNSANNLTAQQIWNYVNVPANTTLGYYIWNYGNRTLSFHLDVACLSENYMNENMNCIINAKIEDPSTDEKEVNFNCYILDPLTNLNYSDATFSQMVNHTGVTLERNFFLPYNWNNLTQLKLQCEATYEIFGFQNTNRFYTTFITRARGPNEIGGNGFYINQNATTISGSFLTGRAISVFGKSYTITKTFIIYFFIIFSLLALIILLMILAVKSYKKKSYNWKDIKR